MKALDERLENDPRYVALRDAFRADLAAIAAQPTGAVKSYPDRWSDEEIDYLRKLYASGASRVTMARLLKRSMNALHAAIHRHIGPGKHWPTRPKRGAA